MSAIVALRGGVAVRIDVQCVVRASLNTRFATDAAFRIEIDDTVRSLVKCCHRANRHTRCRVTVIAPHDRKKPPAVGKRAFFDVFDPCAIHADRHLMLALARHRTGVAADALAIVDYETKGRHDGVGPLLIQF